MSPQTTPYDDHTSRFFLVLVLLQNTPQMPFVCRPKFYLKKVTLAQRCQTSPNVVPINFHLMLSCQNTFQKFIRWLFKIFIRNDLHF